eukprot:421533_1
MKKYLLFICFISLFLEQSYCASLCASICDSFKSCFCDCCDKKQPEPMRLRLDSSVTSYSIDDTGVDKMERADRKILAYGYGHTYAETYVPDDVLDLTWKYFEPPTTTIKIELFGQVDDPFKSRRWLDWHSSTVYVYQVRSQSNGAVKIPMIGRNGEFFIPSNVSIKKARKDKMKQKLEMTIRMEGELCHMYPDATLFMDVDPWGGRMPHPTTLFKPFLTSCTMSVEHNGDVLRRVRAPDCGVTWQNGFSAFQSNFPRATFCVTVPPQPPQPREQNVENTPTMLDHLDLRRGKRARRNGHREQERDLPDLCSKLFVI